MDIEQIRSEVKRARQQFDEQDRMGAAPIAYDGFLHYRDRNIVARLEFLLSDRDGQIKTLKEIIEGLRKELHSQFILNSVNPEGIKYLEMNKNQAEIIKEQREEIDDLQHENKQLDSNVRGNEIFFESLKKILDRTRPITAAK